MYSILKFPFSLCIVFESWLYYKLELGVVFVYYILDIIFFKIQLILLYLTFPYGTFRYGSWAFASHCESSVVHRCNGTAANTRELRRLVIDKFGIHFSGHRQNGCRKSARFPTRVVHHCYEYVTKIRNMDQFTSEASGYCVTGGW